MFFVKFEDCYLLEFICMTILMVQPFIFIDLIIFYILINENLQVNSHYFQKNKPWLKAMLEFDKNCKIKFIFYTLK